MAVQPASAGPYGSVSAVVLATLIRDDHLPPVSDRVEVEIAKLFRELQHQRLCGTTNARYVGNQVSERQILPHFGVIPLRQPTAHFCVPGGLVCRRSIPLSRMCESDALQLCGAYDSYSIDEEGSQDSQMGG